MAKGKKYYVVWEGHNPGIYEDWKSAKEQIDNFTNAQYKGYPTKIEATEAFRNGKTFVSKKNTSINIHPNSISVDAACSGNPGAMEYRGVITNTGRELFKQGPFEDGTNNIGEFLAIVHGLGYLKRLGKTDTIIYTDSKTAMAWVRNKRVKTTLQKTPKNAQLFDMIDRALTWLQLNKYSNPILKWETKELGEIPADFGRK